MHNRTPAHDRALFRAAGALMAGLVLAAPALADDRLRAVVDDDARPAAEKARDDARNPYETLTFFGIQPDMTVVELAPSGGWYTEILAPYLAEQGQYVAGHFDLSIDDPPGYFEPAMAAWRERVADVERFGEPVVVPFHPPKTTDLGPAGSADMVLSFRSVHGWKRDGVFDEVLQAARDVLKPGGTFGIVGHRMPEDADDSRFNGYVKSSWVVARAEANGFRLVDSSEVNANPADTADHPNGVWTLPPGLNVPEGEDPAGYEAIGESDRFTLKFERR
ncbi:class I SAM-dependent methyltransferase [Wenzhouxiangella sp. XN79A]|uniref:class I SAM-dependent methyltransferase n=1 Tax=Wenzhouxiangella sp. XN79A TaxID=2724193 RepID=UPI00144AB8ED|nr:class I SAM-dependent methyltransferase [Wenzhouxiangella sp. XN79A]NKI34112.1 class I SAM-dependent methyltransferase [Wenzhouxiangella sp. XN79A]